MRKIKRKRTKTRRNKNNKINFQRRNKTRRNQRKYTKRRNSRSRKGGVGFWPFTRSPPTSLPLQELQQQQQQKPLGPESRLWNINDDKFGRFTLKASPNLQAFILHDYNTMDPTNNLDASNRSDEEKTAFFLNYIRRPWLKTATFNITFENQQLGGGQFYKFVFTIPNNNELLDYLISMHQQQKVSPKGDTAKAATSANVGVFLKYMGKLIAMKDQFDQTKAYSKEDEQFIEDDAIKQKALAIFNS